MLNDDNTAGNLLCYGQWAVIKLCLMRNCFGLEMGLPNCFAIKNKTFDC